MIGSQSRHNALVKLVEQECKSRGWKNTVTNYEYKFCYKQGEIDVFTLIGKYAIVFECKCNYTQRNYNHAREQLERSSILFNKYKSYKIIAYYNDDNTVGYKWVNRRKIKW